jgi:hypothetical protein
MAPPLTGKNGKVTLDWPRGLSLERTFRDNATVVTVLPGLTEADLEKLGVLLSQRKIMLRATAALRRQADCDRREKANRVRKLGEPMRPVPMITIRCASVYRGTGEAPC